MRGHLFAATAMVAAALTVQAPSLKAVQPGESAADRFARRTVELTYRFSVGRIPDGSKEIIAWVPVPPTNDQQRLARLRVLDNLPYRLLRDSEYGNQFIRFNLSGAGPTREGLAVTVSFLVTRKAQRALPARADEPSTPPAKLARFLAADRMVPTDGKIAAEAKRVASGAADPLAKARRIYDHIVDSMTYDKTGQGWGRGDAVYACDVRKGNCTDFHSLFIGECRALGIPSRFIMGLPLPEAKTAGKIAGYHCWAEFYVAAAGWVPVDASEAHKFPKKREALFGGLDENRIHFTTGRDIVLPLSKSGPVNFVISPHVEINGKLHDSVETDFSFRQVAGDASEMSYPEAVGSDGKEQLAQAGNGRRALHVRRRPPDSAPKID